MPHGWIEGDKAAAAAHASSGDRARNGCGAPKLFGAIGDANGMDPLTVVAVPEKVRSARISGFFCTHNQVHGFHSAIDDWGALNSDVPNHLVDCGVTPREDVLHRNWASATTNCKVGRVWARS